MATPRRVVRFATQSRRRALNDAAPMNMMRTHIAMDPLPQQSRLVRKLSNFIPFSGADIEVLNSLCDHTETYRPDSDVVIEGETPRSAFVVTEGLACAYRNMQDGRRQIIAFLLPGDISDVHVFLTKSMDHSIAALTRLKLATIPRDKMVDTFFQHPRIAAALWWNSLQDKAILRERIVALGRRRARGRVAYLLCELWWRHHSVGLTQGQTLTLPITQLELADSIGLTPAHVNRILMSLRDSGIINLSHRLLTVLDLDALQEVGEFNSDYLHLEGASSETAKYFDRIEQAIHPD